LSLETPQLNEKIPIVLIEIEDLDLLKFVTGGISGVALITKKKVKIVGDLELAQELETIFAHSNPEKKHFMTSKL
jgi:hypothetical protein